MIEHVLSRSLRVMFAGGLLVGMHAATAQTVSSNTPSTAEADTAAPDMQRVEVTGSSIKRLAAQGTLPITTIKASEFTAQGLTTAAEVLASLPMNQSSQSSSQSVGAGTGGAAQADLRGLGSNKTLVLLNGRRLASHPFDGASVDLNIIPLSALDRVEVLRDGASAIYGTDAIGGVINFITKRQVTGAEVSVEATDPQHSGGGRERRLNLSGGIGDLDKDGFNLYGIVDVHSQGALNASDRSFSDSSVIPSAGLDNSSGTSSPANFYSANGITGNPYYATGCGNTAAVAGKASTGTCRTDTVKYIQDIPKTKQESFLGKATFKLNETDVATIEYLHARSTNTSSVAPSPLTGITMTSASPYYPGGSAGVPAVAGLTGEDLTINWRTVAAGNRVQYDTSISDRLVLASEGLVGGWDYNVGLNYSVSKAASAFVSGYTNDDAIYAGVLDGTLNPFGAQSAAGTAYLAAATLKGEFLAAKMTSTGVDAKISKQVYDLPGGSVGLAFGSEFRHDKAAYEVNTALASQAQSSGYADAQSQYGQRNIGAVFTEIDLPFTKQVDVDMAARYDHYSDVGGTFNPKIGVRYQPTNAVMFRSSFNTGFRAPTLYDLHGPASTTFTSNAYDDPVLCPGGSAVSGANPNIACGQQQNIRSGGNENLKPEKSKTFSLGVVFEPTKSVTVSFDYFNIRLKDKIGTVSESTMFANYDKYKSDFVYSADGTTLEYVNATLQNLGEVHTSGIDTNLNWRLPRTRAGNFTFNFDGSWVGSYKYQNEAGGAWVQNVGIYGDDNPVFRWKHNATLAWGLGNWGATFSNKYMSGYRDQNTSVDAEYDRYVKFYSTYAISGNYRGFKNTDITVGIKNLFDTDPPFTNQTTNFQTGYDARYTDPIGRTLYVKATYKF